MKYKYPYIIRDIEIELNRRELQRRNSRYRADLKNRATKPELIIKDWLTERGNKYIFQKGFLKPFHRIADFYLPIHRLIIEIDGGYHQYTKNKDSYKDKIWDEKRGMKTIRITNEQVYNGTYKYLLSFL